MDVYGGDNAGATHAREPADAEGANGDLGAPGAGVGAMGGSGPEGGTMDEHGGDREGGTEGDAGEVKRLTGQLAKAQERVRTLEIGQARLEAAAAHGLPADLHAFITAEDAEGAMEQAARLAAHVSPPAPRDTGTELPPAGGRNPANGGGEAARHDERTRFEALRDLVPSLNNRVLRH
ncbi:MAG TPA: hypothetical protein VKT77_00030 [Chthonomonadaceae bacterium]|nr:hypothetical protein [Chthonomonadaceae bacterium]